ncbi:MAG: hypothetical protein M1827_007448 [Pycnora praestabilis]|nr:MAG: hypothetical protein M1827_007448 [Pycnora praestabilis]
MSSPANLQPAGRMAKPSVGFDPEKYTTIKVILFNMTLNQEQFNHLRTSTIKFIEDHPATIEKSMKRLFNKAPWDGFVDEFLEDNGNGAKFWSADRVDFDTNTSFLWPPDKEEIRFLTFCLLKWEAVKYGKASRKDAGFDEEGTPVSSSPAPQSKAVKQSTNKRDAANEEDGVHGSPGASPSVAKKQRKDIEEVRTARKTTESAASTRDSSKNSENDKHHKVPSTPSYKAGKNIGKNNSPSSDDITEPPLRYSVAAQAAGQAKKLSGLNTGSGATEKSASNSTKSVQKEVEKIKETTEEKAKTPNLVTNAKSKTLVQDEAMKDHFRVAGSGDRSVSVGADVGGTSFGVHVPSRTGSHDIATPPEDEVIGGIVMTEVLTNYERGSDSPRDAPDTITVKRRGGTPSRTQQAAALGIFESPAGTLNAEIVDKSLLKSKSGPRLGKDKQANAQADAAVENLKLPLVATKGTELAIPVVSQGDINQSAANTPSSTPRSGSIAALARSTLIPDVLFTININGNPENLCVGLPADATWSMFYGKVAVDLEKDDKVALAKAVGVSFTVAGQQKGVRFAVKPGEGDRAFAKVMKLAVETDDEDGVEAKFFY